MKKLKVFYLIPALLFLFFCAPKQGIIEKIYENGVEVIINHIEPYKVNGESPVMSLRKEYLIDTENEEIARAGLIDINSFDIDSQENIYFLLPNPSEKEHVVYKFDKDGNFMTSFGRRGQGPFEFQYPYFIRITDDDEILIKESSKSKFYTFASDGVPVKETPLDQAIDYLVPLKNGNYVGLYWHKPESDSKYFSLSFNLYNSELAELNELDRFRSFPNRMLAETLSEKIINGINHVFVCEQSGDRVYIGNCERGYEILVYDLEGHLFRKIRKEYSPVKVSEDYKTEYLKPYVETEDPWANNWAQKIYFPEHWYPFYTFFPDDEGRLYVMTYEEGESPGEYFFDIFNSDGIFIARKSLKASLSRGRLPVLNIKAKMNRLYCVEEKENGYKMLVIYEMQWR